MPNKKIIAIVGVLVLALAGFLIYYFDNKNKAGGGDDKTPPPPPPPPPPPNSAAVLAEEGEVIDNNDATEEHIQDTLINSNAPLPSSSEYGHYYLKPTEGSSRPLNTLPNIPNKEYCGNVKCGKSCAAGIRNQDCLAGMDCCMSIYHRNSSEESDHARNCWYSCFNTRSRNAQGVLTKEGKERCDDTCMYV